MTKLCKDCKYFDRQSISGSMSNECGHPKNIDKPNTNMVTGEIKVRHKNSPRYMRMQRWWIAAMDGHCGASGRWFEPKPVVFNISLADGGITIKEITR
jgi:hypothetical protein